MSDEKIRLGGMALPNGVLVHGPRSWACAIRRTDGTIQVAAEEKRFLAAQVKQPFLRGPARLAESLAFLPRLRKLLPEARFPFERPAVLAARAPERWRAPARAAAQLVALGASTEIFGWMTRHPENRIARALAKPGHELQHRLATAEPTAEQLEVAEAALRACLELEQQDGADRAA